MREIGGNILFSASDLMRFMGCAHATTLDLMLLRGEGPEPGEDSEDAALLQKQGDAHEAAHLERLKVSGRSVIEIPRGNLARDAKATRVALTEGSEVVFQGAFLSGNWGGWSDFLERVERPSALGPFSYEVADTKLKRRPHPKHVLQLVLYSDLLAEVQGAAPEFAHVELGSGERATLRLADYAHYARGARARLENFVANPSHTRPIPCADCALCRWADHCESVWAAEDSLFNVAGISRGQVKKLEVSGITTMQALSRLDHPIRGMAETTRAKLGTQARLQHARKTGGPTYELRAPETGKGFDLLPAPALGDLFYDIDGPQALPETLARLWLLAPLEEECRAGWLLNSYGFRVDPGRGRLAGSVDERAALFGRLGRALGERLIELYDLIERDWAGFAEGSGLADRNAASGRAVFLESLTRLLTADVSRDAEDERLETHLHREGGLAHLFREREALPTGLPAPFAPFLRVDQVRWQIAGSLAEQSRLRRLTGWRGIADIAHSVVSLKAAELLQRLGFQAPQTFDAAKLVKAELGENKQVDPETAAKLGAVLDEDFVNALAWTEQQELLRAAAAARFQMADGSWREARMAPRNAVDADEEERRILAFAPDTDVADGSYTNAALSFYRLAARQSGFQRTAETFERWAHKTVDQAARCALLSYVAEGGQGERLGALLARARPHWLPDDPDELRQCSLVEGLDDDTRGRLMTSLYPSLARSIGSGRWSPFDPGSTEPWDAPPDPTEELARIRDWWRREHTDQRRNYDTRVWPDGFIPGRLRDCEATDDRLGWFTFFALGIFRTLGWNNQGAHKSFVEAAVREGWWQEMAEARFPNDSVTVGELSEAAIPWLKRLEDFARPDVWQIEFPQWRRTISDLYALARWLPDYADAFRLLPVVVDREGLVSLSKLWRISYEPIWQRRGLEGAPLSQSLGLGANWMIREAIRHGLWLDDEAICMQPYAWAATGRLRRLFAERLAYPLGERGHMDLSPEIHGFVADHLGPDAAFLGDLDLPLQLWNGDSQEQADATEYDDETEE